MAYYGGRGRGRGRGGGGGWFVPGADGWGLPWGRGAGAAGPSAGGDRETLAAVMARRAPPPSAIRRATMRAAEAAAGEVVLLVHPTREAERRRQDVIAYLTRLIGSSVGCEVFAFGSVPLRAYLPDGDVDITVLGNTWLNSTFIDDVRSVLESEQENCDAEFKVTGLQFINAEVYIPTSVKLMKCVVENIVVDVSFNQIGGVSTFCFLEMVDRQVGKNHLFKRSIMLIKAWCYHESRILGAHHGLISTYALETLVLYIFNMFHKSLHGPLEAFYRFLEYFSKFDWDQYGISLNGPVDLSSLTNLTVEPTIVQDELLFGEEFRQGSLDRLVVIPNESDGCDTQFRLKFLNIIDPLKRSNNLGRSVSKANFYRIRSAFSFGAQKLGQILMLPSEYIRDEIYGFFANTLKRHGKGERPDIGNYLLGPESALSEDGSRLKFSCMHEGENGSSCHSPKLSDKHLSVTDVHKNSGRYLPGLVQDLPWNKIWFMESASDFRVDSSYLPSFRSHFSFSHENGNGNSKECFENYAAEEDLHLISTLHVSHEIYANHPLHKLANSTRTNILDCSSSCPDNESDWTALHADKMPLLPFLLSNMLDLSGDLDLHLGCLRRVQYHLESLFDELLHTVEESCLAGALDEDSFKIPAIFKPKSNTGTESPSLSLNFSTDSERRKLSPVYCSHSTGDDSQQTHAEVQADVVWQQKLPLSSNVSSLSSSPVTNSDSYPVSWFCVSPKSQGTGTYIPKMSYYTYQERMTLEKEIMRERKQRQRVPDRQNSSVGKGFTGLQTEHTTAQSTTNQSNSPQQNGYSSKSSVLDGDFVHYKEHAATDTERQTRPSSSGIVLPHNGQGNPFVLDTCQPTENKQVVDNEKGRQTRPQSPSEIVLPRNGQGNPLVLDTCLPSPSNADYHQLKAQPMLNFEFGSIRLSLGLLPAQFEKAFPALPTRKRAAEVPPPSSKGPAPAEGEAPATMAVGTKPAEIKSRSQEMFQLRDEADFPPLQAGFR
ncbi:hypothetical protein U9M48_016214 [Paspalum notatum var. saurae]|uniref:PAP/OAS1 substrate-binding-related domain-containing protein n=1 Tax=Paspalum notatum var. saurae TaxID=547442 RepID=A0AAQ3WMK9_PASNO